MATKVLTSLAMAGGLSATYYALPAAMSTPGYLASRFHRSGQVADSEADWPVPCVYREDFTEADTGVTDGSPPKFPNPSCGDPPPGSSSNDDDFERFDHQMWCVSHR